MSKKINSTTRFITNKELSFENDEKEKRAVELAVANKEVVFQNGEREKRAAELIIANQELVFQNREKAKRAAELVIANAELVFQNAEKEKRAAELAVANEELIFQNTEKAKRAAELVVANAELGVQNIEKEKRAAELVVANKELIFQNAEKEKRAAELVLANAELIFQNGEKENRAAELIIANEELKMANAELESFSYSVSHDLRAPLRAINGFTQVLIEDYMGQMDGEAKTLLDEIIGNSNKMGQLIDNLLEFSRLGRQVFSKSKVNIEHLVKSVVAELYRTTPESADTITINNLENVSGDKNMLKQVFINLISNALKYSSKRKAPLIEIGSYRDLEYCTYYVKDNGAGFDMRYYDKLFGVFQRLHSSNEFEGTGVGLAIIQKIILKHEGKVWAEGKVNVGASFYISLPYESIL